LGEENINETMVNEGLVEVVRKQQNKDNAEVLHLIELEESAKIASKGKWSSTPSEKREVIYEVEEPAKLVNKTFAGIVEHVRDGSTLRVALVIEPKVKYQMITLMISGIRCPQTGEPFGEEARYFTESRLLQRDIEVRIEQISGGGNTSSFVGSVTIGDKNIAEYLIKEGFAKCLDWSLGLTKEPKTLRTLEKEAKAKKLRIWKDYKDIVRSAGSSESFDAKVIEIVNGDALVVQNLATNEVKKVFIASIRPPRLEGNKSDEPQDKKQFRPLYDIPHMFEAREFLRKRLIGKKVSVKVDYIQPKTENFPEKTCCTIILDNINIGEALISKGLATVVKYRPDDEQRASGYDAFLAAETKAQKSSKGMYSNSKEAGIVRIVDLSSDQSKAKQYLPFLLRNQSARKEAVVEFIFPSSSKLKVYIPKENCLLNLILVGINSPKSNETIGSEALNFVKQRIHQKDVQISIEAMDKVGNFIGWVYFDDGKNLAIELVKNGFASVRDLNKLNELNSAEAEAKRRRIGIWKDYKEEEHNEALQEAIADEDNDKENSDLDKRKKVVVTNITNDMSSFHAQYVDDGPKLEELLTELREELSTNPPLPGAYKPTKGDLVVAKFSADQQWYRAKIEKMVSQNEAQVIYIDYGNRETVATRNIAAMPSGKYSGLSAAAKEYTLAFVRLDTDPEFIEEVKAVFAEETADRVLLLKSEYRDSSGLDAVTLVDEETKKDIILELVLEGLFFVDSKGRRERRLQKTLNEYKAAQETAKKKRVLFPLILIFSFILIKFFHLYS
jgi:staphylococcal nuclease domain-containing protein 1